uniref:Uncharacterized protein n=1 Tax=Knipowitschia caucasica TaxID=637954 RepID=A0AAV2LG25_KNICA
MAGAPSLCALLLLLFPLGTLQAGGQQVPHHEAQAAPPPPPPPRTLVSHNENPSEEQSNHDVTKVVVFIAASIGIFVLMVVVYCIYNQFYTKQQYQHTQLNDQDFPSGLYDPPPVFFHGSTFSSASDVRKCGYGSLSASASIISVPPSLSPPPPPRALPFPPPFVSSHSLRTISARDLQRGCS